MRMPAQLNGIHARTRSKAGAELFRTGGGGERSRLLEIRNDRQIARLGEDGTMHKVAILMEPRLLRPSLRSVGFGRIGQRVGASGNQPE